MTQVNDAGGTGNTPEITVDPETIESAKKILADAISATTGLAKASLREFVDVFAPKIARQAIAAQSPDPIAAQTAQQNIVHLKAQAIADAGRYGVELQQRWELALGAIIQTAFAALIAL